MLPELPLSLVLHLIYIIMRYPIRIVIKDRSAQILLLKLIIGVDNRLGMILIFYDMQPGKYITLKIFNRLICRLVLYIQNWWQISICKMYLLQKEICLIASRRLITPKMINTTDKTIIPRLIKILSEIIIQT